MPTFIDESGDTGPIDGGGTSYFRLAAVWVPTLNDADLFRETVQSLRRRLGLLRGFEFKFAKTHNRPDLREAFFSAALSQEFRFVVGTVDKMIDREVSSDCESIHWACATEIAAALRPVYQRAEQGRKLPLKELVVVDDNGDKNYLKIIKRQFRGLKSTLPAGTSMIGKVQFRDSLTHDMLQLADMICGAVGAMIDGNEKTWYDQIAQRDLARRSSR